MREYQEGAETERTHHHRNSCLLDRMLHSIRMRFPLQLVRCRRDHKKLDRCCTLFQMMVPLSTDSKRQLKIINYYFSKPKTMFDFYVKFTTGIIATPTILP